MLTLLLDYLVLPNFLIDTILINLALSSTKHKQIKTDPNTIYALLALLLDFSCLSITSIIFISI